MNAKDDNGCTPLDLASYAGHTDCVRTLLTNENQADVLVYSHKSRRTALHAAAYNGHTDCLKLLLQNAEAEGIVDCLDGQERFVCFFIS